MLIWLILVNCCTVLGTSGSYPREVREALNYLQSVQNEDGGFPYRAGQSSSQSVTCWVILALEAAGEKIDDPGWTVGGNSPGGFISNCSEELKSSCDYARTLLALSSSQQKPSYNGTDLISSILSFQQEDGQFAWIVRGEKGFINSHIWSILALDAAGEQVPDSEKARQWLADRQNNDGGFGWCEGVPSDADDTAAAIRALMVLGENLEESAVIKGALLYLKSCQGEDGGFSSGYLGGDKSNAASDAWVIQALISTGQSPTAEVWSRNNKNAVTHLLGLQDPSGFFNYMPGVDAGPIQTTATALISLCGLPGQAGAGPQVPVPPESAMPSFTDVPSSYWAYEPIGELVKTGVLSGYPDGTFKPERPVNRAEFAAMIVRGLGLSADDYAGDSSFKDVPADFWAFTSIHICVENRYVTGMPGEIYNPNGNITGAQMAAILVRALPGQAPGAGSGPEWYADLVQGAGEQGLLYPGFQAEVPASRAQCAYSIMKLRQILGLD